MLGEVSEVNFALPDEVAGTAALFCPPGINLGQNGSFAKIILGNEVHRMQGQWHGEDFMPDTGDDDFGSAGCFGTHFVAFIALEVKQEVDDQPAVVGEPAADFVGGGV